MMFFVPMKAVVAICCLLFNFSPSASFSISSPSLHGRSSQSRNHHNALRSPFTSGGGRCRSSCKNHIQRKDGKNVLTVTESQLHMRRRNDPYRLGPPRKRRRRRWNFQSIRIPSFTVQRLLVYINVLMYVYQITSAVTYTPTLNAILSKSGYAGNPISAIDIAKRNIIGGSAIVIYGRSAMKRGLRDPRMRRSMFPSSVKASSTGPVTMDFIHQMSLTRSQPHRWLTGGFLHGSVLHLGFNMRYLWRIPSWLEEGLGWPLYLSTYLVSIVSGNVMHSHYSPNIACLGASGGICGLTGLMFIMYRKMGRIRQSNSVLKNMILLVLFGLLDPRISNPGHIGGFVAGVVMGFVFGPNFRKSYVAKKWTFMDDSNQKLRGAMGPDIVQNAPMLRLSYGLLGLAIALWYRPDLMQCPRLIWRGLLHPGSLSGVRAML